MNAGVYSPPVLLQRNKQKEHTRLGIVQIQQGLKKTPRRRQCRHSHDSKQVVVREWRAGWLSEKVKRGKAEATTQSLVMESFLCQLTGGAGASICAMGITKM